MTQAQPEDGLFRVIDEIDDHDDDITQFLPTHLAGGPWNPSHQHGGAVPILQLATLSDFASGTGNDMDYSKYTSINPDLTIHVLREPRSEWIGFRGLTRRAKDGIGQSHATIHDLDGPIANVSASLLLDRR